MSWTTPAEIRAQVQKLWDKGTILASFIDGPALFPRRLVLKGPSSTEMTEQFDPVRAWIAELRRGTHYRLIVREFQHRVLGANSVPDEIWVDTLEDALALIGRGKEAKKFAAIVALTRQQQPTLLPWISKQPLRALELAGDWTRLLEIVGWMQTHPRPSLYLRQMDIPGVHTKFVEANRAVLSALFDLALAPDTIDTQATGAGQFCRRYGFRDKPMRVRFRVLDPHRAILPVATDQDLTINHHAFSQLNMRVSRVFITENEVNFLAFPNVADSLVIFGAGYGFEMLAQAEWLQRCAVYYWGDIDTHGFAILDQLRASVAHAESFLMDRETLLAHEPQWGEEPQPLVRDLPRLTEQEHALYDDLRDNRIRKALRLEQERIGFGWIEAAVGRICGRG